MLMIPVGVHIKISDGALVDGSIGVPRRMTRMVVTNEIHGTTVDGHGKRAMIENSQAILKTTAFESSLKVLGDFPLALLAHVCHRSNLSVCSVELSFSLTQLI
jgi:hypothetical protein